MQSSVAVGDLKLLRKAAVHCLKLNSKVVQALTYTWGTFSLEKESDFLAALGKTEVTV